MNPFTPTTEQKSVIEDALDTGSSALVVAGPGTGKTRIAIEVARRKVWLLDEELRRRILFLSFSNAAIERLASTAGVYFTPEEKKHLCFMTYHSCAASILRHYGRFVGLPPNIRIADKLEERLLCIESGWAEDDEASKCGLIEVAKTKGLLSFDILIPLADKLLRSSAGLRTVIARHYPLIVVDEFQDTSESQWRLLQALGADSQVIAFADPNQIIYASIHAATVQRMREFEEWKRVAATPFSTKNFRCSDGDILKFADCLLNGIPFGSRKTDNVHIFNVDYRTKRRGIVALIWKAIQDKVGKSETIAVLAPSNVLVEKIAVELRSPPKDSPIRFPVHVQMARDEAAYDAVVLAVAALHDLAYSPSDLTSRKAAVSLLALNTHWNSRVKIKAGQVESIAKGLMAQLPMPSMPLGEFIVGLKMEHDLASRVPAFIDCLAGLKMFSVTAARISAHGHLQTERIMVDDPQLSLFESFRSARTPKGLSGYDAWKGKTHALTYHKAKGREFDFVILVVDPRCESTKSALDEKRRLYYVCATRAKKWLGVIHFGNDYGPVLGPVIRN